MIVRCIFFGMKFMRFLYKKKIKMKSPYLRNDVRFQMFCSAFDTCFFLCFPASFQMFIRINLHCYRDIRENMCDPAIVEFIWLKFLFCFFCCCWYDSKCIQHLFLAVCLVAMRFDFHSCCWCCSTSRIMWIKINSMHLSLI